MIMYPTLAERLPRPVCVGARRRRRRFREGERVAFGLAVEDVGERGRVQPAWREDVGAALFFEEEGEPEGEVGSVRRAEGGGWALNAYTRTWLDGDVW